MNVKRSLAILALGVALVGCSTPLTHLAAVHPTATPKAASGYLYRTASSATYIRILQDTNGHISGLWYGAIKNTDGTVSSYQGSISGTISGTHVVISFTGIGADTDTGTLSADTQTLTLQYLGTNGQLVSAIYHAATVADYNAAVAALK